MFGLVEFEFRLGWNLYIYIFFLFFLGGGGNPQFFLHTLRCTLPGSALKVPVVGG